MLSNGRCERCGGTVMNIEGRRVRRERLEEIHDESCPQRPVRKRKEGEE